MKIKDAIKRIPLEKLIVDLLSAYALGSSALLIWARAAKEVRFTSLDFTRELGLLPAVLVIGGLFVVFVFLRRFIPAERPFRYLLFGCVSLYFSLLCYYGFNPWFCAFLYIVCAVAVYYCFGRTDEPRPKRPVPARVPTAVLAGAAFVFLALETSLRYANMAADNYDMGVYAQVFDSIAKTGETLIRTASPQAYRFDGAPSPILYPLTLLWMIFHNMYPFLLLQSAALAGGVVPLVLIVKKRGGSDRAQLFAALIWFLYPGLWNGAFYDFHEQSFLAPLILWTLYFAERKKPLLCGAALLLTAAVGWEGAVIALFLGVYFFFTLRERACGIFGLSLGAAALILYFALAPDLLVPNNGVYGNGSFFTFLLKDPGYLLKNLLDENKLQFIVLTLLSLGCLPLITKRKGELLLLAPVLLVTLLGSGYDASVAYQHALAPSALLLYLFVGAFDGLRGRKKQMAAAFCALACLLPFCGQILPRAHYLRDRVKNAEAYRAQYEAVAAIPDGVSVTASPKYIAFLTRCGDLYPYFTAEVGEDGAILRECSDMYVSEYTIIDLSGADAELNAIKVSELLADGFEPVYLEDGIAAVLKR